MKHFVKKRIFKSTFKSDFGDITFRLPSNWYTEDSYNFGEGNGYVVLDKDHPWSGLDYDDIPVEVHGGLTYGQFVDEIHIDWSEGNITKEDIGKYIIGFDTGHYGDNRETWPLERVESETMYLMQQCINVM